MQIVSMAKSTLRTISYPTDVHQFRAERGGHLGGTLHCARYLGSRYLWDSGTGECISEEGVDTQGFDHLKEEFALVRDRAEAALGCSIHLEGVVIPVQQGLPHFRIYDMFTANPETPLTLWRQINLLADMFAELDRKTVYTRPVQYFHTSSLDSETRVTRWLKNWTTRPGCGGVFFKDVEFVYTPGTLAHNACVALGRGGK